MLACTCTVYFFSFVACDCETHGTVGNSHTCDENGKCDCKSNVQGDKCNKCYVGHYNFPACTGGWDKSRCIAQN